MHKILFLLFLFTSFTLSALYAQSSNITLASRWQPAAYNNYSDVWGYADGAGNEYAIIGSSTATHFLNVTNPNSVSLVGSVAGTNSTSWREFKTYVNGSQRYLYGICDACTEGLWIFDLSTLPGSIARVPITTFSPTSFFTSAHMLFVDEPNHRLYISGANSPEPGRNGLIVLDISNPIAPVELFNGALEGGYIHDIYVRNHIVYASSGYEGYYIFNFTNAASPFLVDFMTTNGYNHSSWLTPSGNYAVIAEEVPEGLPLLSTDLGDINYNVSYNVSGGGFLNKDKSFKSPLLAPGAMNNIYHNPYVKGDYMYVSAYEDGVQVWAYSDPMNPTLVGYYDTYPANTSSYTGYKGCWGVYPYLPSGTILASDISNGLFVLRPSGILPVKFGEFTATLQGNQQVALKWTTESEAYSKEFVVERSTDGKNYTPVGTVAAAGQSQTTRHYQLTDPYPAKAINYYRIKQVDQDRTYAYSMVQSVRLGLPETAISLYLTTDNTLVIQSEELITRPLQLTIYNAQAQPVFSTTVSELSSSATYIPIGDVPAGAYVARLHNADVSKNQSFVVTH